MACLPGRGATLGSKRRCSRFEGALVVSGSAVVALATHVMNHRNKRPGWGHTTTKHHVACSKHRMINVPAWAIFSVPTL